MTIRHGELAGLDATRCAGLVRARELTPLELVDAAIDRAEQVNGALNAIVTRMYESARETARAHSGAGIFAGVPFLVKDFLAEVEGVRFTEASAFLGNHVPAEDSELVRRFRAAGLVLIGKTNTPELAIGPTTEPRLFGPTRNPWDPERTSGGSSGGAAAAVAARVVPMAHGNDAGGSIRIPASCCGLVGLKPSRGRVSLAPHYGDMWSGLVSELGVTRSVRDTAAMLDAVAGPAVGEPYFPAPPERSYTGEVERPPGSLKIGFSVESPLGDAIDSECERAVRDAAALCESLGHTVEESCPDYDAEELWTKFTTLLSGGAAWAIADWERRIGRTAGPEHFEPFVWAFGERGRALGAHDYLLAVQDVQRAVRDVSAFFGRHDLWLTATLGQPPVELGTLVYRGGDPFELRRRCAEFSPYTWIANASGQPAISVPLHWSRAGLPVGVHFVARWGEEATLIRLAGQLERAHPWAHRHPGICAV
ncbi:MAG: amidase [Gammaproteobacteria bacterium]|nr:amidase [Gammaproteobacteria bacterium]